MLHTYLDGRQVLTRYLEPYKIIDLLKSASLYLRRIDLFKDPKEGRLNRDDRITQLTEQANILRDLGMYDENEFRNTLGYFLSKDIFMTRKGGFVCSWYDLPDENPSMWSTFCPAGGVLLSTTAGRLSRALSSVDHWVNDDVSQSWRKHASPHLSGNPLAQDMLAQVLDGQRHVYLHPVDYIDWSRDRAWQLGRHITFCKDKDEFAQEREIRLLAYRLPLMTDELITFADSVRIPVNLRSLIRRIVLAPGSDAAFADEIKGLLRDAKLSTNLVAFSILGT